MEVFHLARFARAFFFARRFAQAIQLAGRENEKGEPADRFAFVSLRRLLAYFNASRAALTAASTCSGAVPPGWLRLATEPSSVR